MKSNIVTIKVTGKEAPPFPTEYLIMGLAGAAALGLLILAARRK